MYAGASAGSMSAWQCVVRCGQRGRRGAVLGSRQAYERGRFRARGAFCKAECSSLGVVGVVQTWGRGRRTGRSEFRCGVGLAT